MKTHRVALLMFLTACASSPSDGRPDAGPGRGCFPPSRSAAIDLGCAPSKRPAVKTTGACTLTEGEAGTERYVYLQANDAGICHVELTFENGGKSSIDVKIMAAWPRSGSESHDCGQDFFAVDESGSRCVPSACTVPLPKPMCDAEIKDAGGD